MNLRCKLTLAALAASLLCRSGAPALAAPVPLTPASLSPCALTAQEIQAVFGLAVEKSERADMTLPGGRDLGCVYTFQGSSLEIQIRQTWDDRRPATAQSVTQGKGFQPLPNDPDGAALKAGGPDTPGSGGEMVYVRGKVQTRIVVRGGRLTGTEVMQRLQLLRRVP
jgi:hypothetical protein